MDVEMDWSLESSDMASQEAFTTLDKPSRTLQCYQICNLYPHLIPFPKTDGVMFILQTWLYGVMTLHLFSSR